MKFILSHHAQREMVRRGIPFDLLESLLKSPLLEDYMKITYDSEVDVLRILFSNTPIEESDEGKPGVILDYDKDGNIVGLEILDASKRMENPRAVEYAVTS